MSDDHKPHLFVKDVFTSQKFTTTQKGNSSKALPERDRTNHGNNLLSAINEIWDQHIFESANRKEKELPSAEGEYLTFKSSANDNLKLESLDSKGAKLLNVKRDSETHEQIATIFIPEDKIGGLVKKVEEYLTENFRYKGEDTGKPKNQALIDTIDSVRRATIENLWSSSIEFLPRDQQIWCELWLDTEEVSVESMLKTLGRVNKLFGIESTGQFFTFPQRTIVIVRANYIQLAELIKSFPLIAEIRKAEEPNSFWLNEITIAREDWIADALQNTDFTNENNFVTILDSGINNGHQLLEPILADKDRHAADASWGISDNNGHGTMMAGVVGYGNLNSFLENPYANYVSHQIESVKILPVNGNHFYQYPFVMLDAISTVQIVNPQYRRIYCMAVTSEYQNDFGKPSTWSAVLDNIIFGDDDQDKKIFVVSVGNVREEEDWKNYPESNLNLAVESPAQSWNSIGIGAFTEKVFPDGQTLASHSELSPFSRTSSSWDNSWPIKPDVVFEGGNIEGSAIGNVALHDDLELLTTSRVAATNNFTTINATSAATALASNFLAKLRDYYPDAWPETCRALMIHSARWTQGMYDQFGFEASKKSSEALKMLRIFGYGVPNLERAVSCKSNYLTFISEEVLQPYEKIGSDIKTKDIHYYEFPWPKEILENLGDASTTLRITLSYFIEPNPGDKGYSTKYSYQSTALRFVLINPGEDFDNFKLRTNKINQDALKTELGMDMKESLDSGTMEKEKGSDRWSLGADNVFKGSIHSNYWTGTAVEIASCNKLAIYPQASGWWKQLKRQGKHNSTIRYSLIVSIETPENSQDIYTPIATRLALENHVKV
ncbi:S8 family peptidase [Flavobacterium procerum]|uniref:S8 family peptidase n=1 Tax=Flavobacterium procerum TaxID=1455569 RepID=A0ABV6BVN9_9FLAO